MSRKAAHGDTRRATSGSLTDDELFRVYRLRTFVRGTTEARMQFSSARCAGVEYLLNNRCRASRRGQALRRADRARFQFLLSGLVEVSVTPTPLIPF
ncbi:hypothetical protein EVAR_76233_1 [Eumeta japonica]|uniref:Uncharacterized protein n=1 Tax=Eumeta variegata TaxID=151549 RepID=A0A4C1UP78_EUMVA|nr:hypothetical protein EVAR_76233_1 [Eumeta japonica]